jgi:hypothetical protein
MSEQTNAKPTAQSLKEKLAARKAEAAKQLVSPGAIASIAKSEEVAAQNGKTEEVPSIGSSNQFESIQGFNGEAFLTLLNRFELELEAKAPGIASYLKEIHKNLNQYQELSYLLTDEQLNLVASGFFHVTDTKMAEVVVKSKSKKATVTIDEAEKLFM